MIKNEKSKNYINSCKLVTTCACAITIFRIKADFFWKSHFPGLCWSFELKSCLHIEWTFISIASTSTKKNSQSFRLISWSRSYANVSFTCLTAFVQLNLDKPFCIIEIDGNTLIVGLWSDEWMEIFNQNRKLDSALCWLFQNFWRCQMADFWIQKYILDKNRENLTNLLKYGKC